MPNTPKDAPVMSMSEWLQSLKKGDRVIAKGGPMRSSALLTVTGVVKNKVTLSNNMTFSQKTGLEIGGGAHYSWNIMPVTDGEIEHIRQTRLASDFKNMNFNALSYRQLKAMKSAMEANAPVAIEEKTAAVAAPSTPSAPSSLQDELE